MKKNGFTLVELLAVIIILGIIALITFPIITRVLNNTRDDSEKTSVDLYASAIETAAMDYKLTNKKYIAGTFTVTNEGHTLTNEDEEVLEIDFSRSTVICNIVSIDHSGVVSLTGCTVNDSTDIYDYISTNSKGSIKRQ